MVIEYEFGGDDIHPADEFEYYPDSSDVSEVIRDCLFHMNHDDLVDMVYYNMSYDDLYDYFRDEIKDAFESAAFAEYEEEH